MTKSQILSRLALLEARVTALEGSPRPQRPKLDPRQRKEFLNAVAEAVAQEFQVDVSDLTGISRKEYLTWSRHAACGLSYELGLKFGRRDRVTLEDIGAFYGGRDHGTVLHAYRRMADLMTTCSLYRASVEAVRLKLAESPAEK